MAVSPERGPLPIEERPEEFPEIPIEVEHKGVITPTPSQFTAQVTDEKGQPIIQTPASEQVTIQLPSEEAQLTAFSKGTPDEAITWFGAIWLRMLKKALLLGWRVLRKGEGSAT